MRCQLDGCQKKISEGKKYCNSVCYNKDRNDLKTTRLLLKRYKKYLHEQKFGRPRKNAQTIKEICEKAGISTATYYKKGRKQ